MADHENKQRKWVKFSNTGDEGQDVGYVKFHNNDHFGVIEYRSSEICKSMIPNLLSQWSVGYINNTIGNLTQNIIIISINLTCPRLKHQSFITALESYFVVWIFNQGIVRDFDTMSLWYTSTNTWIWFKAISIRFKWNSVQMELEACHTREIGDESEPSWQNLVSSSLQNSRVAKGQCSPREDEHECVCQQRINRDTLALLECAL